jgi:hypothetical protein
MQRMVPSKLGEGKGSIIMVGGFFWCEEADRVKKE